MDIIIRNETPTDYRAVEAFDGEFPPKEKSGCPARKNSISTAILLW